jgi:hypothetical protein
MHKISNGYVPLNIVKSTAWGVDWRAERSQKDMNNQCLINMLDDPVQLNFWLSRFVTEVRKWRALPPMLHSTHPVHPSTEDVAYKPRHSGSWIRAHASFTTSIIPAIPSSDLTNYSIMIKPQLQLSQISSSCFFVFILVSYCCIMYITSCILHRMY